MELITVVATFMVQAPDVSYKTFTGVIYECDKLRVFVPGMPFQLRNVGG